MTLPSQPKKASLALIIVSATYKATIANVAETMIKASKHAEACRAGKLFARAARYSRTRSDREYNPSA
jgi:hypothetical protein